MTRRKSRRETRSLLTDLKNGTLRRSNSAELISEVGDSDEDEADSRRNGGVVSNTRQLNNSHGVVGGGGGAAMQGGDEVRMFRGLRISDKPSEKVISNNNTIDSVANKNNRNNIVNLQQLHQQQHQQQRRRVRHNSDGNYDDINLMQETIMSVGGGKNVGGGKIVGGRSDDVGGNSFFGPTKHRAAVGCHDSIYENLMPLYSTDTRIVPTPPPATAAMADKTSSGPPPIFPRKSSAVACSSARRELDFSDSKTIRPPLSSDTSSIDSHNDSGYSTRIAVSEGPSPPLLESSEPLLDPQALYMIPPDMSAAAAKGNDSGLKACDSGFINYDDCSTDDLDMRMAQAAAVINPKSSFV